MTAVAELIPLLSEGYEEKCIELGIIQRKRAFKNPADLMMLCLFHLINECSLMDVSEVARLLKIGEFSDVAFMDKFGQCGAWFEWIAQRIARGIVADFPKPSYLEAYRVMAVDASDVVEKGRSGQSYRLHYAIDIFKMNTAQYKITTQEVGESLVNFEVNCGDLIIADRAYGTVNGIGHCIDSGADYILRLRTNCFKIYNEQGKPLDMLGLLEGLDYEQSKEFSGAIRYRNRMIPVRICAKRKSCEACQTSLKKLRRKAGKQQRILGSKTVLMNEYITLATSLSTDITADEVLETYRYRWQIECYFKRLKSIMNLGDLPKKRKTSSLSWLNGKIMVALLMEMLLSKRSFSPEVICQSGT